jgi:carboxypeptidase Q
MRTNINLLRNALTLLSVCCVSGFSDDRTLDAIRNKAQAESRVMDDAFLLSDVYGPRFLASPSSHDAADWVKKRLEEIGLRGARLEGIGPVEEAGFRWSQRGWSYQRFSLNLLEPQYANLTAIPVPFSPSSLGVKQGVPIRVDLPQPSTEALSNFFERYRGKLQGKMLLIRPARPIPLATKPQLLRLTDQQLSELATPPVGPSGAPALQSPSSAARPPSLAEIRSNFNQLFRFLREEGVVAMINGAPGESGNLFVSSPLGVPDPDPVPPPMGSNS